MARGGRPLQSRTVPRGEPALSRLPRPRRRAHCPINGPRPAQEFSFGGESNPRPAPDAPVHELARYLFFRRNVAAPNVEWWYHRDGCRQWFLALRDTRNNVVQETYRPSERAERD